MFLTNHVDFAAAQGEIIPTRSLVILHLAFVLVQLDLGNTQVHHGFFDVTKVRLEKLNIPKHSLV